MLQHLPTCAFLRDLTVNASCTDEIRAPILTRIESLEKLTIYNPSRAVLELLPEWLRRLSGTLLGFHLKVRDTVHASVFVVTVHLLPGQLRLYHPWRSPFLHTSHPEDPFVCIGAIIFTYQ